MRPILFIHHTFPGLTATFVYREARALAARGVPIRHLSCKKPPARRVHGDARDLAVETAYVPAMRRPAFWMAVAGAFLAHPARAVALFCAVVSGERAARVPSLARAVMIFVRGLYAAAVVMRDRRVGHIHAPFSTDIATIAMIAADLTGLPWSFSSHTAYDDRLVRRKVRSAAFVRSISDYDRERLLARSSRRFADKVHIVHCGLDLDEWRFAPRSAPGDPPAVLSVGTLQEKKGHAVLIDAAAVLARQGVDFRLTIAGGGELAEDLADQVRRLSLEDKVRLAGPLSQKAIRALYDEADVFALGCVYASNGDRDGIPVVLMEAMALGVPCVSTTVSGIPELMTDGEQGLLAPPGAVGALSACIERMMCDRPLRIAVATAARKRIEDSFNIRKSAAALATLFERHTMKEARALRVRRREARRPRVAYITPLPTPYRQPLLDRLTELDDMDVTVFYCAGGEADRSWTVPVPRNASHRFPPGFQIRIGGGPKPFYNHVNPSIWRELSRGDFDAVVVPGYALMTAWIAMKWAMFHRRPFLVQCESHTPADRGALRRTVKEVLLKAVVRAAAGGLPTGTLAREYLAHYGMRDDRMFFMPNTTDVHGIARRVDALRRDRDAIKDRLGIERRFVAVFVGRLIGAKAPLEMLDAFERVAAERPDWALAIVGDGELEPEMRRRIAERGIAGVHLLGFRQGDALPEVYAASDLFVLPSRQEPWGVVVNEAAAAALPMLLSDKVGAARDLLEPGRNGAIFPAVDVDAMTAAWLALAARGDLAEMGKRSREIVSAWDYDFAVSELRRALGCVLSLRSTGARTSGPTCERRRST